MTYDYDVIIIGGGPGGYIAAERAGERGAKVLLVEKDQLGGVCLNKGCIPTKTLLHSAKLYHHAKQAESFGVSCKEVSYNLDKVMTRKNSIVETSRNGVAYLLKQAHVDVIKGDAKLNSRQSIAVNQNVYKGKNIILATGASCAIPSFEGARGAGVFTSDGILELKTIPDDLVIIGGGVIGIEFASYFSMLGVKVSVVEILPEILNQFDPDVAKLVRQALPNCSFHLNTKVMKIGDDKVSIEKNGKRSSLKANNILLATGRTPNITGLGLEGLHLDMSKQGIVVNEKMQTNLPGIYAIGDVTGKSMLAHAASRMGEVAVNTILGDRDHMRYHAIPWVVYSYPEVAGVGLNETEACTRNIPVKTVTLPLRINGRFLAEHGNQRGVCKMVVNQETRVLLGLTMVGGNCSEIIYGAAAMIEEEFRLEDIVDVVFPHPTVSEIIKDAAWLIKKDRSF